MTPMESLMGTTALRWDGDLQRSNPPRVVHIFVESAAS